MNDGKEKKPTEVFFTSLFQSLVFRLLLCSVNSPSGPWDNTASMLQGVVYPVNGLEGGLSLTVYSNRAVLNDSLDDSVAPSRRCGWIYRLFLCPRIRESDCL